MSAGDVKFSICIPNYNYGKYLGDTIQSVLDQTHQHFEIVVADNASTDDSLDVVRSFKDERIRIIENQYNIGFAPNLDRATEPARYPHMILLSSDDRMKPTALERYAEILSRADLDNDRTVIVSEAHVIDGDGNVSGRVRRQPGTFLFFVDTAEGADDARHSEDVETFPGREVLPTVLRHLTALGPFLSVAYPRRLYDEVQGYRNVHNVDPDAHFTHKLLLRDPTVVYVNEALFEYRVHGANQGATEKKHASIKHPIDKYLYTLEYTDKLLAGTGLKQQDIVDSFVANWCLKQPVARAAEGRYGEAVRTWMFGLATYPEQMLKDPRSYAVAALLGCGPAAGWVARQTLKLSRMVRGHRYGVPRKSEAPRRADA